MIDEKSFVQQPLGFGILKDGGKYLVCNLKQLLYGLKPLGRNWFFTLGNFFMSIGFKDSQSDPCLFLRHSQVVADYVACWIDDLVYCSDDNNYEEFELVLRKKQLVSDFREEKLLGNFGMSELLRLL